jgi:hypothetical protein
MKVLLLSEDFVHKSWGMRKVYGKYTLRIIGQVLRDWEVEEFVNFQRTSIFIHPFSTH